jgi:hypothetical protein
MNGSYPETVIAEIQTEDTANAPFIAFEIVTQVVAIVYAIKATWDLISFLDKGTELLLDDGKKLEIAEKVVLRLKQAGLEVPGDRAQRWIEYILERRTRPSKG